VTSFLLFLFSFCAAKQRSSSLNRVVFLERRHAYWMRWRYALFCVVLCSTTVVLFSPMLPFCLLSSACCLLLAVFCLLSFACCLSLAMLCLARSLDSLFVFVLHDLNEFYLNT
jgi:membrane glycosyltransferase